MITPFYTLFYSISLTPTSEEKSLDWREVKTIKKKRAVGGW